MHTNHTGIREQILSSRTIAILGLFTTIVISSVSRPARADVRGGFSTVAISGGVAPEFAGNAAFSTVNYDGAVIGNSGVVVFSAVATGPGFPLGFWAGTTPANVAYVGMIGGPAPGTPDTFSNATDTPSVNSGGELAAFALLSGPDVTSGNSEGIWLGHPAADTPVVREGMPTLIGGLRYGSELSILNDYAPALSDSGLVAFQTGLQNTTGTPIAGSANWVAFGASVTPLALTGGPVPGLPPGATFTSLGSPGINPSGMIVYSGAFQNPAGPVTSGTGIWTAANAPSAPIVLAGQQALAAGNGVTFQAVSFLTSPDGTNAHLNASGTAVFFATLTGAGIQANVNSQSVWLGLGFGGPPLLVAQQGAGAPGLSAGTTFAAFNDTGLGNGALTGMLATVNGPGITSANNTGIWTGVPGNLHLIVRNGDSIADGANAPITVSGLGHFAMNANGEFVTQLQDHSIIGENAAGHLAIVARIGDSIQVAPGDFRTITALTLLDRGSFAGEGSPINDFGTVAFAATFVGGSTAVLTSNILAVPEPATAILAATGALLGIAWASARRRAKCRV
jgi:hypothetical protein